MVFLAVGALFSIGHGLAWTAMPEADRAKELEMWMPTREQTSEQLTTMLGSYGQVVAHRASFVFMAQTTVLLSVLLLAVRRHDAAGDGAVQVGLPRWPPPIC